ncbi:hypothetical protein MRY87_10020 [bacterium]|nr:hypothetical protein [bacterium]
MVNLIAAALSGISLLLLYPAAALSTGLPFLLLFSLHLATHLIAVGLSLRALSAPFSGKPAERALWLFGVLVPLTLLVLLGLTPVTARDALIHHLAIPKLWLRAGHMIEVPWHEWSYYPMLLQLGFLGFLKLDTPLLASLYHGSYLILAAGLARGLVASQRAPWKLPPSAEQFTVILFLSTPLFLRLGSAPYVDLPLVAYGVAALHLITQILSEPRARNHISALLLGAFLGLSAGMKYNGLLFAGVALGLFAIGAHFRAREHSAEPKGRDALLSSLLITIGAFLLIASSWYLKNWWLTGNPIYPLFSSFFHELPSPYRELPRLPASSAPSNTPIDLFSAPLSFLSLPFQMMIFGRDHTASGFDGVVSPLLLFLLCSPLVGWHRERKTGAIPIGLLLFFGYCYLALELSGARVRYLAPVLGVGGILAVVGICGITERLSRKREAVILFAMIFQISFGYLFLYRYSLGGERLTFLFSSESAQSFLSQRVTESHLAELVSKETPTDAKIYLLHTGNRYALYDREVINSGYYSDKLLLKWIKDRSGISLRERFQREGITHIAIHRRRYEESFEQYRKEKFLTEEDLKRWNTFVTESLSPIIEAPPYLLATVKAP